MIRIDTRELTRHLHNVALFAAAPDEQLDLDVVRLNWDGHHLHLQAMDGHRIAWALPETGPTGGHPDEPWSACVRVRSLAAPKTGALRALTPTRSDRATWTQIVHRGDRIDFHREAGTSPAVTAELAAFDRPFPDFGARMTRISQCPPATSVALALTKLRVFGRIRQDTVEPVVLQVTERYADFRIGRRFRAVIAPVRFDAGGPAEPHPALNPPSQPPAT